MIGHIAIASALLLAASTAAHAATMACSFAKDGTAVDESCQLDSAGTTDCMYEYSGETPSLFGFCYAYPADEAGTKVLAGCAFAAAEANVTAMRNSNRADSATRATPQALEPGFYAVGDTIGVHDDILVGFMQGTEGPTYSAYCTSAGK